MGVILMAPDIVSNAFQNYSYSIHTATDLALIYYGSSTPLLVQLLYRAIQTLLFNWVQTAKSSTIPVQ